MPLSLFPYHVVDDSYGPLGTVLGDPAALLPSLGSNVADKDLPMTFFIWAEQVWCKQEAQPVALTTPPVDHHLHEATVVAQFVCSSAGSALMTGAPRTRRLRGPRNRNPRAVPGADT
jgi:hypothetical protein